MTDLIFTRGRWIPYHGPISIEERDLISVLSKRFVCVPSGPEGKLFLYPVGSAQSASTSATTLAGTLYQRGEEEYHGESRSRHDPVETVHPLHHLEYRTEVHIECTDDSLPTGEEGVFGDEVMHAACNQLPWTKWTRDVDDVNTARAQLCVTYIGDSRSTSVHPVVISLKSVRKVEDVVDRFSGLSLSADGLQVVNR